MTPAKGGPVAKGRVVSWSTDDGWGVIVSEEVPDQVWAHFGAVDVSGFSSLDVDEVVDFTWEASRQDGFDYRATWVRPIRFREQEPSL